MAYRALIVSRNLPPLRGGIERLMGEVVAALARAGECHVIGPSGCARQLPPGVRVTELPAAAPLFLLTGVVAVFAARLRGRCDVCVGGNGLVAPLVALAGWLSRARTLLFVHGLDLLAPSALYQRAFIPLIRRAETVVANSAFTAGVARERGVPPSSLRVLHPGTDLEAVPPGDFRERHGLGAGPLLLAVGRLVPRKGVAALVSQSLPLIRARHPDAVLAVIGDEPAAAVLASTGERARIQAAAKAQGLTNAVRLLGSVPDAELRAAYAAADVLVFPSLSDSRDAEGFGMVVVEAAAQGTPAVAFASGGVPDAVGADCGRLVPPGDFAAFAEGVLQVLATRGEALGAACRRHAARFGWPRFAAEVVHLVRGGAA